MVLLLSGRSPRFLFVYFIQRAAAVDASVERRAATGCGRELITDEAAAMPSSQAAIRCAKNEN